MGLISPHPENWPHGTMACREKENRGRPRQRNKEEVYERDCPLHNVHRPTSPPGERIIAISHAKVITWNCLKIAPRLSRACPPSPVLPPFKINRRLHFPAWVCAKYTRNRLISCVAERGPSRMHTRNVKSVKKYCRANPLWYLAVTFTGMDPRRLQAAIPDLRKIFLCALHSVQLHRAAAECEVCLSCDLYMYLIIDRGRKLRRFIFKRYTWCKFKHNNNNCEIENIIPRARAD